MDTISLFDEYTFVIRILYFLEFSKFIKSLEKFSIQHTRQDYPIKLALFPYKQRIKLLE